ncbi:small GTPase [Planoprotostelium fungivorum]|uniref:Small GTPase n=1 Tax=Planoprotostelium fungivorum TaxID=1890364 RepID=A0A2P6NAF2_9EUKA|nr:small GTPase [Planoprotostelium fungivorum]
MVIAFNCGKITWLSLAIFSTILTLGALSAAISIPIYVWNEKGTYEQGGTQVFIENNGEAAINGTLRPHELIDFRWDHLVTRDPNDDEGIQVCFYRLGAEGDHYCPDDFGLVNIRVSIKSGKNPKLIPGYSSSYVDPISHCSDVIKSCQGSIFIVVGLEDSNETSYECDFFGKIKRERLDVGTCGINRVVYTWILISVALPLITLCFCCMCVSVLFWFAFRRSMVVTPMRTMLRREEAARWKIGLSNWLIREVWCLLCTPEREYSKRSTLVNYATVEVWREMKHEGAKQAQPKRETIMHASPTPLTVVVLGDAAIGKKSLITSYKGMWPREYEPQIPKQAETELFIEVAWVTANDAAFELMGPLCFPATADVFILCFSIARPMSLLNIRDKWLPELKNRANHARIILCGTMSDLRYDPDTVDALHAQGLAPICPRWASDTATKMSIDTYIECSSTAQKGLDSLFFEIASSSRRQHSMEQVEILHARRRSDSDAQQCCCDMRVRAKSSQASLKRKHSKVKKLLTGHS